MTAYFNHELPETSTSLKDTGMTKLAPASLVEKYGQIAENVMQAVCECFGVDRDDLIGKRKTRPLAWYRHIAIALTYEMSEELSLTKVGEIYGGRNHATVIYSVKQVKSSIDLFTPQLTDVQKVIRKIKELKS